MKFESSKPCARATPSLTYREGAGRRGLPCWIHRPPVVDPDQPTIVTVHGIGRAAKDQAKAFRSVSRGSLVVAPIFEDRAWPAYQRVVRKGRADLALLDLLSELRLAGEAISSRFILVGYSGGAQFAHRFAMLYPHLIERLILVSAGWYTFPDQTPFPYGLGAEGSGKGWGARLAARFDEFVRLPILAAVGARDDSEDASTRRGADLDRQQGAARLERGKRWVEALRLAARVRGADPSRIEFAALPDAGHDFRECIKLGGLLERAFPAAGSTAGKRPCMERSNRHAISASTQIMEQTHVS